MASALDIDPRLCRGAVDRSQFRITLDWRRLEHDVPRQPHRGILGTCQRRRLAAETQQAQRPAQLVRRRAHSTFTLPCWTLQPLLVRGRAVYYEDRMQRFLLSVLRLSKAELL